MFAYCGNNPLNRSDPSGCAWDIIFDVGSFILSAAEFAANPTDLWALASFSADLLDVILPLVSGLGETVRAVKAGKNITEVADDLYDAKKIAKSVHGNSLDYPGTNFGYILSDMTTGEVVKYGESINPAYRYSQKYLNGENPIGKPLGMTVVISGTKRDVHIWQHEQIVDFIETIGDLPQLNKSKW